jgi:indole-3-glycerol phosphate synthase
MSILSEIYEYKKNFVENRKIKSDINKLKELSANYAPKGFAAKIKDSVSKKNISIIGELKKASPSAGIIFNNKDYFNIAKKYQNNEISCLSILTDEKFFKGSDSDLVGIRAIVDIPIIRKDFILDSYQLYESKMLGADCILLILSMIDINLAKDLEAEAMDIGLDVLIETHNKEEMDNALTMKSELIGVNNRNLNDFTVDIDNTISLTNTSVCDKIYVSESGIRSRSDINYIIDKSPARTFLIGESLMRSERLEEQIRTLLSF